LFYYSLVRKCEGEKIYNHTDNH